MYNNSTPITTVFINTIRFTPSKQQRERSEAGTGITMIVQAHAVSFYLVRWVGVSSVISRNKLTCDWPDWPVACGTEMGRSYIWRVLA